MGWSSGRDLEANIDLKVIAEQMVVKITGLANMFQDKGFQDKIRRIQMKKLGKAHLCRERRKMKLKGGQERVP